MTRTPHTPATPAFIADEDTTTPAATGVDNDAAPAANINIPPSENTPYPVRITPHIAALIAEHGPYSAIARQYMPDNRELTRLPDEDDDPTGDAPHSPVKGIVHRHPDRVLLKPLHACAVYCRFCFRREMVGPAKDVLAPDELDEAFAYIENNPQIWEVILTGGDPLLLSPRRLRDILNRLAQIDHVAVIRIHSRIPLAEPARINDELLAALATTKPLYVIIHTNHPDEISADVTAALARLRAGGISLLSQSVLLAGVNDDADILENLFRTLVRLHIKPYYLHHPDRAPGTGHFRVSLAAGQDLMNTLRARLSGLCLPNYVLDIAGGAGKVPVGPSYAQTDDQGRTVIRDTAGGIHIYDDSLDARS